MKQTSGWKAKTRTSGPDWAVAFGLAGAVLFFLVSGSVTYSNIRTIREDNSRVSLSHEVIVTLQDALSSAQDAETGQRGFLLTGNASYLQPYNSAISQLPNQLNQIGQLLQGNLAQQERLTILRQDVATKLAELKNTIALRQTQGFNAALTVVNTDLGKADMNAIRAQISSMRQAEEALREQRIAEMTHAQDRALSSNIIAALVGPLLTLAVGLLIRQASLTRKRQEWFQSGEVGLEALIRGEQRTTELGENILGFMAHYLGAIAGAMYVNEGGSFHRVATYGVPAGATIPEQFRPKEGLLGQAAAENHQLSINDVPDGYLAFGSALGQGKPTQLLILPGAVDDEVNTVLELGFIHHADEYVIALLQQISAAIASVVRSAKYRDELRALLAEMQHKSEELQVQGEELRVSNEELEQASRYKSDFLANMSHELRTPLNSLLILAKLLADNTEDNLTAEQTKYAQTIQSSGNDLLTLINDILDLSKIEAGHVTIQPETVPLERLTENLHQLFLPVSQEKQLGFVITTAPDLPGAISTDLQRLEQVLKNLLSNAFKFTERGEVQLEIKPAASNRIAFAVTDTGIGISPDQQAQIFSAFHQADSTISRKYGGTGLGLSISRELARLLGGSIQVQSQPDNGSVFTVIIPES